ncbi:unnamed protein product [Prunus armeniaca]|uniref:Glutathione S-transferase n=1 Tax=Prunus armeniaca TaxID=36596 RepID=A0A6J5TKK3_PRUAR|nr:unnamed protein product [Prunus armeniaca]
MRGIAAAQGEEARKAAIELAEGLALLKEAFEKTSKGKDFFSGDKFGYLDIAFGCFLGWLRVTEKMNGLKPLDETKTPGLAKWAHKFCAAASVKDVILWLFFFGYSQSLMVVVCHGTDPNFTTNVL